MTALNASPRQGPDLYNWRPTRGMAAVLSFMVCVSWLTACGQHDDTIVSIALHPTNPQILYVSTNDSIYKSRDEGRTWEQMATDLSTYRVLSLALDPKYPATVYAGTMMDAVYKSPDGGQHWMPYNAGLKEHISVVNQFVFDPRSNDTIYAATTVGVFRTTNGGRLWEERMQGMKEVHIVVTLAIDPTRPNILYAGTTGGAYRTKDGTSSWLKINNGLIPPEVLDASMALGINVLVVDPVNSDTVYAGTTKGLFKTVNQGESWTRIGQSLSDQYISSLLVDPRDSQVLYAGGRAGVQKTHDGGQTWTTMNAGLATLNVRTLAMSPQDRHRLYLGTNGSGLYRSIDGGKTWASLPLMIPPASPGIR